MKNLKFPMFLAALLLILSTRVQADLSIAKEIEVQKVHFDSSSYVLSPDSKIILDQTITLLARMNESYSIKVMGFADSKGPEELNLDLSFKRANMVAAYLISKGIDRNRVLINGLGHENPVAPNDSEEGRLLNRRVEFKFINPDTSNLQLTASTEILTVSPEQPKEEEIVPIAQTPTPEEPKPQPVEENISEMTVDPVDEPAKDTMLAPKKKVINKYQAEHIYEDRKRSDAGQAYAQLTPMWTTIDGLQSLGAADNRASSRTSFRGEVGWISFLEESYENYLVAKAYGNFLRFAEDSGSSIDSKQREFTFGGEIGLGRYFHPSFTLQIQVGYGAELIYQAAGSGIEFDRDFIGHAGVSAEAIVWRFSKQGDLGLDMYLNYYELGEDTLETGTGYGINLFVDYDYLRAGLSFSLLELEATTRDYNQWYFGPSFRLYF
jgi:hypothetical protein